MESSKRCVKLFSLIFILRCLTKWFRTGKKTIIGLITVQTWMQCIWFFSQHLELSKPRVLIGPDGFTIEVRMTSRVKIRKKKKQCIKQIDSICQRCERGKSKRSMPRAAGD